jgi:type II secretory ATPase GspE/PulE/Tfp pilus assembly ATPase PilB-like protein
MQTLRQDGWKKVLHGTSSVEEVLRVSKGDRELTLEDHQ